MSAPHGYGGYTNGCRCPVCRDAKRVYMHARRVAAARRRQLVQAGGGRYVATGITHGLAGWKDYSCRCEICSEAHSAEDRRRRTTSRT